jgi:hypothetical protein
MEETDRGYILKEDVEKLMMCVPPHPRYELVKDLLFSVVLLDLLMRILKTDKEQYSIIL